MARAKISAPTKRLVARAARHPPAGTPKSPEGEREGGGDDERGFPRAPFERVVREIAQRHKLDARFEPAAVDALRQASEELLESLFTTAHRLAEHAGRKTIDVEDLALARDVVLRAAASDGGVDGPSPRDRKSMERLVREIAQDCSGGSVGRFQGEAMEALVAAGQDLVVDLFRWGARFAEHAGRTTIGPEDVGLAGSLLLCHAPAPESLEL